jgi:hypothetical protein
LDRSKEYYYLKEYNLSNKLTKFNLNVYSFNYAFFNNSRGSLNNDRHLKKASINHAIKYKLVNDCLSDVVNYAGKSGENIRSSLVSALDYVNNTIATDESLFFISKSLGSKVLRDTLVCGDAKGISASGQQLLSRTDTVFMASNQLPLLGGLDSCTNDINAPTKTLAVLKDQKIAASLVSQKGRLKVISFTDPNDLLSYTVDAGDYELVVGTADKYGESIPIPTLSIPVSNAKTYFGTFENPYTAHTGYLDNEDILDLIMCGTTGCVAKK